jgi:hypothetical protein
MSHGHTKIASRGLCIYCGKRDVRLTDEHVVPFSLGGHHILEAASCLTCADITKKFEQDVAREPLKREVAGSIAFAESLCWNCKLCARESSPYSGLNAIRQLRTV